ncbi:MAG: HD domain-containing protein [Desulfobacterota bacterium]|jgi:HD-GYP domain-containing protein (c-di-GMP phosphodiesterase class II)|nr:HD domain-containing protein [Thermodesulfobacteriota bacterium]
MESFRPVPIDVIQLNEKSVVDLFIKHDERFVPFLGRGGIFTKEQLVELNRFGINKVYIRVTDANAFEEYVHTHSELILTDPTIPPRVKEAAFYVSSIHALRKAMHDPNSERIEEIKNTLKPMFKNIMKNKVLLKDLFSITEHDFNTYTHSINVGIYATALAIHFFEHDASVGMESLEHQCYGYFLHDVGKCMVPLTILRKQGKLSQEEWTVMKRHPQWGYAILMETGHLTDEAAYISMQHHERPDGSGYPFGMSDIHPCARICAIADIFDALISTRSYKSPMKPLDAIEIIRREARSDFDTSLVDTFVRMLGMNNESSGLSRTASG